MSVSVLKEWGSVWVSEYYLCRVPLPRPSLTSPVPYFVRRLLSGGSVSGVVVVSSFGSRFYVHSSLPLFLKVRSPMSFSLDWPCPVPSSLGTGPSSDPSVNPLVSRVPCRLTVRSTLLLRTGGCGMTGLVFVCVRPRDSWTFRAPGSDQFCTKSHSSRRGRDNVYLPQRRKYVTSVPYPQPKSNPD